MQFTVNITMAYMKHVWIDVSVDITERINLIFETNDSRNKFYVDNFALVITHKS